jgi:hypothetical protein
MSAGPTATTRHRASSLPDSNTPSPNTPSTSCDDSFGRGSCGGNGHGTAGDGRTSAALTDPPVDGAPSQRTGSCCSTRRTCRTGATATGATSPPTLGGLTNQSDRHPWRAGCGESRTSGSASGLGKRVGSNAIPRPKPTQPSGSWLNMADIFLGIITRQAIRRGTFTSVKDLVRRRWARCSASCSCRPSVRPDREVVRRARSGQRGARLAGEPLGQGRQVVGHRGGTCQPV